MTSVGVPLIWMGEEVGERSWKEPNKLLKLDWDLLNNPLNDDLFHYYQRLKDS